MAFTLLFVAVLTVGVLVRLWLSSRQIRHVAQHRDAVPDVFAHRISLRSHQRAADYTVARARLGMIETVVDAAVLIGLTLMGGLQWLSVASAGLPGGALVQQIVLVAAVVIVLGLVGLPFTLYRQFGLEARFGFNRMTPRLFVADMVKGIVVGAVLGLPLVAVILWLMQSAGELWWLWAWAVWALFNLAVLWLFPTVIAPLFNKFTPLADADLAERIGALARRCGFALDGLFVMDGSKRSAHGNAYFTGFGKAKRIVFFDTLLSRLNGDEIEAVLAHELGHFKHKHIVRRIVVSFAVSLGFLALLGWLVQRPWFYTGLGVEPSLSGPNHAIALILFFLVMPVFTFLFTPFSSWFSRRDEFEADRFAASQTDPARLVSALVKLYDDNAATLTPDPRHSAFYDSHPPAAIRIGRLAAIAS
ncbi:M48 family metallopeptidase [Achromobacter sp. GG226]|uniref:M48 family metallopeptidase n=1 Tax=Verticiella alkaliphila TaxID=2779529 RepID=UPI001C0D4787|nr:M48 family metallopeptidase [Verticiella sp. GG226]MBU4612358.1 M48 family metallopeptidase [Verticiella sp. GG226]